jgi:hypothetical protein
MSEQTLSICAFRVSGFLTEMVQQIHSLRARGVSSFHAVRTFSEDRIAVCKSVGTVCTTPPAIVLAIGIFYQTVPTQRYEF